jgi:hypothetical protein
LTFYITYVKISKILAQVLCMPSLHERIGYRYGVKDAILDELGDTPGVGAVNLANGQKAEVFLDNPEVASLATNQSGNVSADLRAFVSVPHDEAHLYGIVAVTVEGAGTPAVYGITQIPDRLDGQAKWYAPITRHMPSIRPTSADPDARLRDLPWQVGFMPGQEPGHMVVSYRGDAFVDVIGAPDSDQLILPEFPAELWCPEEPADLIGLVK